MSEQPSKDSLKRRKRLQPCSTGKKITLQERDWLWLRCLHEHGPLASSFLLKFAHELGKSKKRAQERLTDLFNEDNTVHKGCYLTRPSQQFHTLDSRYNQLVYDLTPAGKKALKQAGLWHKGTQSNTGPWLHGFMVSSITASIELATKTLEDITYISQADILERIDRDLSHPVTIIDPTTKKKVTKVLKPDALFGLEYLTLRGKRYRFFVVEADRSTEPLTSRNFNRKSVLKNLLQYQAYIAEGAYKKHLNLTSPLLVLNVSSDPARTEQILKLVENHSSGCNPYMLFQSWEDFATPFRPPAVNHGLLTKAWLRASLGSFTLLL